MYYLYDMNLALLSKHRASLMGLSILWIMVYHLDFHGIDAITRIATKGYLGVEIFSILSGISIYFSLWNNNDLKKYFKKRFFRIIPLYYIIAIPIIFMLFYFSKVTKMQAIMALSLTAPFFNYYITWFITFIIICYSLAPIIFRLLQSSRYNIYLYSFIVCCMVYANIINDNWILARFPFFIIGMVIGYRIKANCSYIPIPYYIILILGLLCLLCISLGINGYYTEKIISIFIMLGFTAIFEYTKYLNKILNFIGGITLECYLLHEHGILQIFGYLFTYHNLIRTAGSIIATIGCASIIHNIYKKLSKHWGI